MYCPYCGYECECDRRAPTPPTSPLGVLIFAGICLVTGLVLRRKSLSPEEERYKAIQEDLEELRKG